MNYGTFSKCTVSYLPIRPGGRRFFLPCRTFLTRKVILESPLTFTRPDGSHHTVPAGFVSDGPSVPLLLAPLLPSRQRIMESGIYHDDLCRKKHDLAWADGEFRLALKAQSIHPCYALVMYLALRVVSPKRSCKSDRRSSWGWLYWLGGWKP